MATAEQCQCGWQALSGDPLPWLLDPGRPNLRWRVLVELVGRPPDSPAVVQARGGANAVEPLASLLQELRPDGTWQTRRGLWPRYAGTGWRVIAAAEWGADPSDPRLHAAVERLLEEAPGEGGFAARSGVPESTALTARLVHAAAELGWGRDLRVREGLAWLEEQEMRDAGTAAATLRALAAAGDPGRERLRERSVELLLHDLQRPARLVGKRAAHFVHPGLGRRSGATEVLWALVRAGVAYDPRARRALELLQATSDSSGRWALGCDVPRSLPIADAARPRAGTASGWITLQAAGSLLAYAVPAGLPRRFPGPPG